MDLTPHITGIRHELAVAAHAGSEETRAAADRLALSLEAGLCLTLLTLLSDAAAEITRELAPGAVGVRLKALRPEFVFTPPPSGATVPTGRRYDDAQVPGMARPSAPHAPSSSAPGEEDDGIARINLRLPVPLKLRVEETAARERLSVNAWLVRAITGALADGDTRPASDSSICAGRNGGRDGLARRCREPLSGAEGRR